MLLGYDTQLTICCVGIIHNKQDVVSRLYTINKMFCRDDQQLTRSCLDMTHN